MLDLDDVVQRGITVARNGEKLWPPPPVQVSAGTPPKEVKPPPGQGGEAAVVDGAASSRSSGMGVAVLFLLTAFSPTQLITNFTVFVLAIVIGYYVIGKVHHALHTPLMSITNAISGIIVVGALLQIGSDDTVIRVLSFVAILLDSINIFGGFAVTRRMLGMFTR